MPVKTNQHSDDSENSDASDGGHSSRSSISGRSHSGHSSESSDDEKPVNTKGKGKLTNKVTPSPSTKLKVGKAVKSGKNVKAKGGKPRQASMSDSEGAASDKDDAMLSSPVASPSGSSRARSESGDSALSKASDDESAISNSDIEKDDKLDAEESDASDIDKSDGILSGGESDDDHAETMSDTSSMVDGTNERAKRSSSAGAANISNQNGIGSSKSSPSDSDTGKMESSVCELCHKEGEKSRRMLRCSKCRCGYHANCFRKKFSKLVSTAADKWFCPDCEKFEGNHDEPRARVLSVKKPLSETTENVPLQFKKVVDAALRAGKKFNMVVMERTEEMSKLASGLLSKVGDDAMKSEDDESDAENALTNDIKSELRKGLSSLKDLLQQLQFASVQAEIDLIKEVRVTTEKRSVMDDLDCKSPGPSRRGNMSRLYTPEQMTLLDGWYQEGPRPDAKEIAKMHQVLNSEAYADDTLQPQGVSLKQIRIWFDNRRAKERLDYVRQKIEEMPAGSMNSEELKLYKAELNQEAKDIIDQRVIELRNRGGKAVESAGSESEKEMEVTKHPKLKGSMRRIRIDYVASVRKAVKVARQLGKNDAEVREVRLAAIEAAKQRLIIPTKWNKSKFIVPAKFVGKEEVNHYKNKLIAMVEDDAKPEEVHDVIELLQSLHVSNKTLASTKISRQIRLVLKKYRDTDKALYKASKQLLDKFQKVARSTNPEDDEEIDEHEEMEDMDDDVKEPKVKLRAPRIKFTVKQLKKLEQYYAEKDKPDTDELTVILRKLNMMRDLKTQPEGITMKQLRAWYYKRRSTQRPPSALVECEDGGEGVSGGTETECDSDDIPLAGAGAKPKTPRPKRARDDKGGGRIYSQAQLEFLENIYTTNPKPPASEISALQEKVNSKELSDESLNPFGLSKKQIKTWFSNRRAKETTDFVREKVLEATRNKTIDENDEESLEKFKQNARMEVRDLIDARSQLGTDSKSKGLSTPRDAKAKEMDDDENSDEDDEEEDKKEQKVKSENIHKSSPSSSSESKGSPEHDSKESPEKRKRSASDHGFTNPKLVKLFHRSDSSSLPRSIGSHVLCKSWSKSSNSTPYWGSSADKALAEAAVLEVPVHPLRTEESQNAVISRIIQKRLCEKQET